MTAIKAVLPSNCSEPGELPLHLDVRRACHELGGLHRQSLDRLVRAGKLERIKIGSRSLISRESLLALIEASRCAR
jgi:hypothetical protein